MMIISPVAEAGARNTQIFGETSSEDLAWIGHTNSQSSALHLFLYMLFGEGCGFSFGK